MSQHPPFERTDLPRATAVVAAPVADVYAVVTDVTSWPSWMPDVLEPVIAKGDDRYLFRREHNGRTDHNEGLVIVRGPTHTFGVQIDAIDRVWFRTRPSSTGTKVDIVLEPVGAAPWRQRLRGRRRRLEQERWVQDALSGLADHATPDA
ncbi:SRPBCC family protein [Acidimicrobiia bacterium EGI L10123]|uniref:SRPBCC family protein n=1 Tax=Salinilacustrithrix flava TaxID=2957203 RepID=UPI003D7C2D5A|nr:SRPBCC family protein [Acidimicrobiia bacterium EGI L10123]